MHRRRFGSNPAPETRIARAALPPARANLTVPGGKGQLLSPSISAAAAQILRTQSSMAFPPTVGQAARAWPGQAHDSKSTYMNRAIYG
jgi:hypothetical protein